MNQAATPARKLYFLFSLALVLLTMGMIFRLSAQPSVQSAQTSGGLLLWIYQNLGICLSQNVIRTAAHFLEYAGFGMLVMNLLSVSFGYLRPLLSSALSWGYAWSDEIHQLFVPGRAFQLSDLVVDLAGILLGTAFFTVLVLFVVAHRKKKAAA